MSSTARSSIQQLTLHLRLKPNLKAFKVDTSQQLLLSTNELKLPA